MGLKTGIEWCDSTVNPSTGCDGCELWNGRDIRTCYAGNLHETRLAKSLPELYAENFQEVRLAPGRMMEAARWPDIKGKKRPDKPWLNGLPRMIFVGDMGDFGSRDVPDDYFIDEVIGAIRSTAGTRHFWLLLSKQISRLAKLSARIGGLPDNCMALTTITSQHTAEVRRRELLDVECRWRGISVEPLWEPLDLTERGRGLYCESCLDRSTHWCVDPVIDWVIVGGESGANAKPTQPSWIRDIVEQCADANVPCFVKQLGADWAKHANALHEKGGDPAEWPADLRVRQVPQLLATSTVQQPSPRKESDL
jgi:protein gp37